MINLAKINKKMSVDVKGVLDLTDGIVRVEVEDVDAPVIFSELVKEFDGKDVKIALTFGEEL